MSFLIYLFSTLLATKLCFTQTNTDVNIRCVPLRDCPDIAHLVKSNENEYVQEILKFSNCGYENNYYPKVWCPVLKIVNCVTPDKKSGRCQPVQKCDAFKTILEAPDELPVATKVFIYKHKCKDPENPRGFSICCPTNSEPHVTQKPVAVTTTPLIPRPSEGECGQQLIYKIVGGKETEMDEYPWTAILEYDDGDEKIQGCGGSLISNRYVVTAAHCVDNSAVRHLGNLTHIILGEYDTRNKTDCITRLGITECADPPVRVAVEEIIVHPQWYSKPAATVNHDIALVRLARPVNPTDYIKPICIPSSSLVLQDKQILEVVGWGQTEKGRASSVKLKTQLPVYNKNQCAQKYKQEKRLNIGDGEICAGGEAGKDSCSGDSGGPLMFSVVRSDYTAWFLAGVVSFGPNQPCGVKNYPGLYTYLPKYVDWIHKTVKP